MIRVGMFMMFSLISHKLESRALFIYSITYRFRLFVMLFCRMDGFIVALEIDGLARVFIVPTYILLDFFLETFRIWTKEKPSD